MPALFGCTSTACHAPPLCKPFPGSSEKRVNSEIQMRVLLPSPRSQTTCACDVRRFGNVNSDERMSTLTAYSWLLGIPARTHLLSLLADDVTTTVSFIHTVHIY